MTWYDNERRRETCEYSNGKIGYGISDERQCENVSQNHFIGQQYIQARTTME